MKERNTLAWYSYFLMNVPESFILIGVSLAVFGISVKDNLKACIIFAFTQGAIIFVANTLIENSYKPFLTFLSFFIMLMVIFRYSLLKTLIITLTSFVFLGLFEVVFSLTYVHIFPVSYEELLTMPLKRILSSFMFVQVPMLLTLYVLLKFKLKIKLPSFID